MVACRQHLLCRESPRMPLPPLPDMQTPLRDFGCSYGGQQSRDQELHPSLQTMNSLQLRKLTSHQQQVRFLFPLLSGKDTFKSIWRLLKLWQFGISHSTH